MASQRPQGTLPNPYAQSALPNPYASATVASAAPVKFTEEQAKAEQLKKKTAFHNPHTIKRPTAKKGAAFVKKPIMPTISVSKSETGTAPQQHGIDYYRSTADDDAAILEERRQRQYDDRQRKKEMKKFQKQYGYWNPQAPHKPERYSNLKAYKASGGYRRKKQAFNDYLRQRAASLDQSRPYCDESSASRESSSPQSLLPPNSPPAPPEVVVASQPQPSPPLSGPGSIPAASNAATISAPPVLYASATISAPPVRFERPDVTMTDADEPVYDERPTKRQKVSKAEAMMAKMGYVKGQGLGKNSDGVVTHLEVKMRKVPQAGSVFDEDGGKIKSQQVWDVRGGLRTQKDEPGKFGEESSVVVTWGCVEHMDWHENAQRNDGGIRQEIGEVFSAKFGPVQQVQIDEDSKDGAVYIKFESVMSALNAVNRFDEGYEFQGRKIRARYYDEKKWQAGIWDH